MRIVFILLVLLASFANIAIGHEVRPAYLQLRQASRDTFDILWKVPALGDNLRLGLYVELPSSCENRSAPRGEFTSGSFTQRWTVKCSGGLNGETIRIAGLSATMTDVLVRLERRDGTTQVVRLSPALPWFIVEASPGKMQVAATYMRLGIEHILGGIDHLLYILAMLLLVKGWRRVVLTMTAFTATHSVTLSAAALGFVNVPQPPVEATIALSIVFVASEIARARLGRSGLTERWPWAVSFIFGLLHGFGFAGGLNEVGMPQNAIPVALLFFNVGVEIGQLIFVAGVLGLLALLRRLRISVPRRLEFVPPYAIGGVAAFWVIQRLAAF
jgi:hydrogenase/urease accessory protein HupE